MMMSHTVINFVLFQAGWFACVLSGAAQQPLIGVAITAAIILFHLWRAQQPGNELLLLLMAMLIGGLWDSVLVWNQWLDYPSGIILDNTAPYWIVAMWALFATTLNVSLRWLKSKYALAVLLGAICGPLAYHAGARLGAVEFVEASSATIALMLGWAVFTPILVALSSRMDGYPMLSRRQR